MKGIFAAGLGLVSVVTANTWGSNIGFGNATVVFESGGQLPLLQLDYATYRASSYNKQSDTYVWKNIRFGAPPVGQFRWAKPQPPGIEEGIIERAKGSPCPQSPLILGGLTGSIGRKATTGIIIEALKAAAALSGEDCLFLDLYVPSKALSVAQNGGKKLPVVVWTFGGAYVIGSKDVLYQGNDLIRNSGGNMIMVFPNHRVGAFGWLAGTTVENQGLANAGLWDQRAAFEWVRKYIGSVGGDPYEVTAWGQSSGAGSLMHHLIAGGGTIDPLFKRVFMQSPAFHVVWDRRGPPEQGYRKFESLAGCAGQGLACLRAIPYRDLQRANEKANVQVTPGIFAFGPTPDGKLFRQLPALEFAAGRFWKGLESLIVSHTSDEGSLFYPRTIKTDTDLVNFAVQIFPDSYEHRKIYAKLDQFYPPLANPNSPFKVEGDRAKLVIAEAIFACNTRYLTEHYANRTWVMQFSSGNGMHGGDVFVTWQRPKSDSAVLQQRMYHSYIISHALTGNPNTLRLPENPFWPLADPRGRFVRNTMDVNKLTYTLIEDPTTPKERCNFWVDEQKAVVALDGYPAY